VVARVTDARGTGVSLFKRFVSPLLRLGLKDGPLDHLLRIFFFVKELSDLTGRIFVSG
jgi:hypothetical protein